MESRFYQTQRVDLGRLAVDLERMFIMQGYQVQHFGNPEQTTVQMKKGGDFSAILGMQRALTLTMQRVQGGVNVVVGQEKWADKAAVGVVGMLILWPLAFTAGAGAIQQAQLGSQALRALDSLVCQQDPGVQINVNSAMQYQPQPAGVGIPPAPPYEQAPPPPPPPPSQAAQPAAHKVICPHCQTANDEGGKFCMKCGKSLVPQEPPKVFCPTCHAEANSLATFCVQCGSPLSQENAST
ncbi:MAG: zinc ribbon domain-containing protein [Ktedonobacteraceae bacterium]